MKASTGVKPSNGTRCEDNMISIGTADESGVKITENSHGGGVYVYYEEIPAVVQELRRLFHVYSVNRIRSKENKEVGLVIPDSYLNISSQEAYRRYLRSEEWQVIRSGVLKRDCFRCQECGCVEGLEVHHLSYRPLFASGRAVDDLSSYVTLCDECHEKMRKGWDRRIRTEKWIP